MGGPPSRAGRLASWSAAGLLAAGLLAVSLLAACGPTSGLGGTCSGDDGCAAGLTCAFGRCRLPCERDDACGAGDASTAIDGRCVTDSDGARACTLPGAERRCEARSDCPAPLVCASGACRNTCAADTPCPPGTRCVSEGGAQLCAFADTPDGGPPAEDGGERFPVLDGGPPAPDAGPTGWPAGFPAACIPEPGARIGRGCQRDGDCFTGICDVEREVEIESAFGEPFTVVHSPGGTCVAAVPADPHGFDEPCGPCAQVEAVGDEVACHDRCALDGPLENGGCRQGYRCDPRVEACLPRCRSDAECRASAPGSSSPTSPGATCDEDTGECVDADGAGAVGDPCALQEDCGADLFCARGGPEIHRRGSCVEPVPGRGFYIEACPEWPGVCTRACEDDADCGDGARCAAAPHYESLTDYTPRRMCLRTCEVGAEPPEDRFGFFGHGAGCAPRMGCYEGVCAPGAYNAVTSPNTGARCFVNDMCWSPEGLGRCDRADTCTVVGCDDPDRGAARCPGGVCAADACRQPCDAPSDCGSDRAACREVDGARVCAEECAGDAECRSGQSCQTVRTFPTDVVADLCSASGFVGCRSTTLGPGASEEDAEGWRSQTIETRLPPAPGVAPCGGGEADAIAFIAPLVDGRLEIQLTVGERLAGVLDFAVCHDAPPIRPYACLPPGETLTVRLRADEPVAIAVVGQIEGDIRRSAVRYRFVEEREIGERCSGRVGCGVGLHCRELAGVARCVPSGECGAGVPVVDLDRYGTLLPDGSLRVSAEASEADVLARTCGAAAGPDLVLRRRARGRERWVVRPEEGALSVRRSCTDSSSELDCGRLDEALVFDVDPGETLDLLSESTGSHRFTVDTRRRASAGAACSPPGEPQRTVCDATTYCERPLFAGSPWVCSAEDAGCGPGVGVTRLGRLPVGVTTVRADAHHAPPPTAAGDALCDAAPRDGLAAFAFSVEVPSSISVTTTAAAGARQSPVWSVREGCTTPAALSCGRALRPATSPLLVPGPTYTLLAWHDQSVEGEISASVRLDAVGTTGQACDGASPCHASLVCDGGVCRATSCGDGAREGQEQCDDGDVEPGDGCDAACRVEGPCGNGRLEPGEGCDDANVASGDGCSSSCALEPLPGGDGCGDAQRLTPIPVGSFTVARGEFARAGATDQIRSPLNPASHSSCASSGFGAGVDRTFVVRAEEGETVRIFSVSGTAQMFYLAAPYCPLGIAAGCGTGVAGDVSTLACPVVPVDGDYTIVVEAVSDPFVFDVVFGDCDLTYEP